MLRPVPRGAPLSILHVAPYPWGPHHEVNEFAGEAAAALAARGHRVCVAAPSDSRAAIRESRRAIAELRERPQSLFERRWTGEHAVSSDGPPVLAVGAGLPLPGGPRPRAAPIPLDASRTLEQLVTGVEWDIVHVHDPFAPSVSSLALRYSRALNVASFHEPSERILSTQVARPLVEIFFGRLDARTVSNRQTAELMERFFPGSYELVPPGAEPAEPWWPGPARDAAGADAARIAFVLREERGALRLFLRALRRLPASARWSAAVWAEGAPPALPLSRRLRERVRFVGPADGPAEGLVAGADVCVLASGGPRLAPSLIRAALSSGTVPVASHLALYEELLADGELGLLFPPGDAITLAGQLERLLATPALARDLRRRGRPRPWAQVAAELEDIYGRIAARRHDPRGHPEIRLRLARRRTIDVDLHMHTDHSPDCATPVATLLDTARARGLGAIAITDHNEISGALEASELAAGKGLKVIVGEEVKTAEQGEVIGLFLTERIERGMTIEETIAEIRRQGGLVYVPHPFDRLHSVPDYDNLLRVVEQIDILEVFNPRVALTAFNEEAERFAAKYRIVPGAGSDSHVAQGLGSVRVRIRDFDGPEEFLEAMRDADIVRKHKNLVYVQTLKWIQTAGGRGGAGAAARAAHKL